ncbi:MAG: right-handed parallel beta-helix repeat-containing protein [Deltaproteobacteria bacterium]|nr:right-handed parallel beta-helix repeat-containing protein [Deltaproteobacteria bacterium]
MASLSPGAAALALAAALCTAACADEDSSWSPTGGGGSAAGGGTGAAAGAGGSGAWDELCSPPRPEPPTIALPTITNESSEYVIDLQHWGIDNNGTDPTGTKDKLNEAIAWAVDNGHGTVRLPAGTYLVGEKTSDIYSGGIELQDDMVFALDPGAIIQMFDNDTWNYCAVAVTGRQDVVITGGEIRGDRQNHVFAGGGAHDEGHTICVQNESERVLIDDVRISQANGDGVLIVGQGGDGSSCKDITIRQSEIFDNRRQGVSIVGGVRVLIEENEIHHIEGTSPQFGIDIESLSYESRDIVIRGNHFHHNAGGDLVNTDASNVYFQDNVCDQTGLAEPQTDGPVVYRNRTDQTISGNTITITVGSSNGRWGIIGYPSETPRAHPNYIENNTFIGGGLHMAGGSGYHVTGNTFEEWMILGTDIECLRLRDNAVTKETGETYKLRRVAGQASGNLVNGEPIVLPLADDAPFTNSPPHLW